MDEQQLLARMRRRILLDAAALCLVPVVWGVLRALGAYWRPMPDFMRGFQEGALMGLALVMVFCTARDLAIRNKPAAIKARFIAEQDERQRMIAYRVGKTVTVTMLYLLVVGMLAASFFSLTVLVTLIAVAMVMCVLIIGCKLYYQRKI
ncbi:MAG: hypothetical protein ACOYJA_12480 [Christensenellales bacterium]|jgi:hypothetical protein